MRFAQNVLNFVRRNKLRMNEKRVWFGQMKIRTEKKEQNDYSPNCIQ